MIKAYLAYIGMKKLNAGELFVRSKRRPAFIFLFSEESLIEPFKEQKCQIFEVEIDTNTLFMVLNAAEKKQYSKDWTLFLLREL